MSRSRVAFIVLRMMTTIVVPDIEKSVRNGRFHLREVKHTNGRGFCFALRRVTGVRLSPV